MCHQPPPERVFSHQIKSRLKGLSSMSPSPLTPACIDIFISNILSDFNVLSFPLLLWTFYLPSFVQDIAHISHYYSLNTTEITMLVDVLPQGKNLNYTKFHTMPYLWGSLSTNTIAMRLSYISFISFRTSQCHRSKNASLTISIVLFTLLGLK